MTEESESWDGTFPLPPILKWVIVNFLPPIVMGTAVAYHLWETTMAIGTGSIPLIAMAGTTWAAILSHTRGSSNA